MPASIQRIFSELGASPAVVTAILAPLLAVLLIAAVRAAALWFLARRIDRPGRMRRARRLSLYLALVVAGLAFQGIWSSSIAQIAAWLANVRGVNEENARTLLETGLSILFSTAALALVIAAVRAGYRAVLVRLRAWSLRAKAIRFQRLEIISPPRLRLFLAGVIRAVYFLFLAAAVVLYLLFLLAAYPATAEVGAGVLGYVASIAFGVLSEIVAYLPNLVYLIIIWTIAFYAIKAARFLMEAVERGAITLPNFDRDWADPTYKLARIGVVMFGAVISYPYLPGAQSEVFRGFSVFLGALLTLGSTAVVGNVISGVVLTYTGSFRVGDRVRIGQTAGDVLEKTLFVTRLRTVENETVSIPNAVVLTGSVTNYNRMAKRSGLIIQVRVGIGYDVSWRKVHELLLSAAAKTEYVESYPPPVVWELSLDDFAVVYELRAATDQPQRFGAIRAALHRNVLDAFHSAGVEIMTPSVRSVRDGSGVAIPAENDPQPNRVPPFRVQTAKPSDDSE